MPSWLRRRSVRVAAVLAAAVLLYALAGFFLAPWVIERQVRSRARDLLNREASVAEVRFNPFTLAATIEGLRLADLDGADLLTVDRFHADLQVSGLFRRALRFREIGIEAPAAFARILEDGRPSIADLLETAAPADEPFRLPRLIVDRLSVTEGAVQFTDAALDPVYQVRFAPLHLDVTNLVTLPEEGGEHTVTVGMGDGAELRWTGRQVVEPLSFVGRLDISDLDLPGLWDYFAREHALDLREGRVDLALPYEIRRGEDRRLHLILDGATVDVHSLAVRPRDGTDDWLTVPALSLAGVSADWPEARAAVERVRIGEPRVRAGLEPDGTLDWTRVLPAGVPEDPAPAGDAPPPAAMETDAPSWTWRIDAVDVEGGAVAFEDASVAPPVAVELAELALHAEALSGDLAAPVPFTLSGRVMADGAIEADGQVAPSPLAVEAAFDVRDIDLAPLRPYLALLPGAEVQSAFASLAGRATVAGPEPAVTLTANGRLDRVELRDLAGTRLAAWERMAIEGFTFEQPPARARIQRLTFDRPFAQVLIDAEGNLNLTRLTAGPETPASTSPTPFEIGVIELRDASADFADDSLILPFRAAIHSANGAIRDVSSFAAAPATLSLEGRVDDTGYVNVDGTLRLADPLASSEILVGFRGIEMLGLTPYFAQFAGYAVESGVLDLDVNYVVLDRRLIGSHRVVARDLALGERVRDSRAPGLAVRLAVALLKDREGRINLDVPVEGSVDSPEFNYRAVFWSAVRTILGNAVTAPFRALGRLFGRDDEDLDLVEFDPGRSDLLPAEQDTLARMAGEIAPRPDLTVTVEGRFDAESDAAALRRARLDALIDSRREAAAAAAAAAGGSTLELILETLFAEQFSAEALEAERGRFTAAPEPSPPPEDVAVPAVPPAFDAAGFYESLRAQLLEAQPVTPADLDALAVARAAAIQTALAASGVEPTRVTLLEPGPAGRRKSGSSRIAAELKMTAGDEE